MCRLTAITKLKEVLNYKFINSRFNAIDLSFTMSIIIKVWETIVLSIYLKLQKHFTVEIQYHPDIYVWPPRDSYVASTCLYIYTL